MPRLKIGIVGCGSVTQIVHLPALYQLSDLFAPVAICDVSPKVLAGLGEAWNIAKRYDNTQDLLALDEIDAVLIANPNAYHAEVTLAALRAGKHALVEKPMCLSLAENDAIIAEQERTGLIVQVGTMRRYAPAFIEACRIVKDMGEIRLAHVHDIIGGNALVIEPTSRLIKADDLPESLMAAMRRRQDEQIQAAIGDVPDALKTAYGMMLGLSTHDTSAMREMLGMPKRVLHASQRRGGRALTAAFDYGDFVCLFSSGSDNIPRYDTWLQVWGDALSVRVDYDTPFVRNLPITLTVSESADGLNHTRSVRQPGWGDAFSEEWRAFHASVTTGSQPKASPQDFRQDLQLFAEMIQLMGRERV